VYRLAAPGVLVRIIGQAPLAATVYALEKLRCNLCGEVFTAPTPPQVGLDKYDASAASMIALLKYGSGLPFHRLQKLQTTLGLPLPAATQWEILQATAKTLEPAGTELIRQAAQGEVVHNDDTTMRVLALMGRRRDAARAGAPAEDAARTGLFTSGIVATRDGRRIALFFTGLQHAGENLAQVLAQRVQGLGPPIQMCDALARNLPASLQTIVANCLAHGRRKFVEQAANFPTECRHVLDVLGAVYRHDALARARHLSAAERRQFHQDHSQALMDGLQQWLIAQLAERQVEPNSGLGQAIRYMLTHWEKLTRFLTVPGAPLDNNLCERALKKAILHRKNALFYKTTNGARVGDLFMSLIHTAELAGANAFHYLTVLQQHARALAQHPQAWMPWNYTAALEGAARA
jgi:transposase